MHLGIRRDFREALGLGAIPNRYRSPLPPKRPAANVPESQRPDRGCAHSEVERDGAVRGNYAGYLYIGVALSTLHGVTRAPLTWRIPPWQPALLFLIAAGCAAVNLYADPSVLVRVATIAVGVLAVVMAVPAARMYLVVDDEGIGVRRLRHERSVDWDEFDRVEVVQRGLDSVTLRITCRDGRYLDVPQSLVMPSRPTGKVRVHARLGDMARQIERYRPR